jgi:transcriptional regulator with XRE-family HTH domain
MARPKGHELSREAWDDVLRLTGRNLTQVAELSDVPRPTLSGLYTGKHRASVPMAHKIASAIGVRPETLFPSLRVSHYVGAGEKVPA